MPKRAQLNLEDFDIGDETKVVDLKLIEGFMVTNRRTAKFKKEELKRLFRKETAAAFIGEIYPGFNLFGFTKGDFSLIDAINHLIAQVGDCELALSTWTVGKNDLNELIGYFEDKRLKKVRMVLDHYFQAMEPAFMKHIRDKFGFDSIRLTKTHAKFVIIRSADYKIVIRTSMNLNKNPRMEDIDITDDPELYDFLDGILIDIFDQHDPTAQITNTVKQFGTEYKALK